jgi:pimeloyl-ACP methyl ester carboxylesterase
MIGGVGNVNVAIEERQVNVGELTTQYLTGGDGPPLVLLHGHGESSGSWRWVLPALARTNRVYAPDFPGAGESAKPPVYSQPPVFYSDFLAAFLDTLGLERVTLVANSHGGNTALRLALSAPGRVTALALVDSSGLGRVINPALIALTLPGYGDAAVAWLSTPLGAPQWVLMLASLAFTLPLLAPSDWLAQQYRLALTPGHLQGAVACLRGELSLAGQREVFLDELPRLTMPTLIVWGTNDVVIPSYQATAAAARLKNCRLVLIPNCGHLPQVERPDMFVAALGPFLADMRVM